MFYGFGRSGRSFTPFLNQRREKRGTETWILSTSWSPPRMTIIQPTIFFFELEKHVGKNIIQIVHIVQRGELPARNICWINLCLASPVPPDSRLCPFVVRWPVTVTAVGQSESRFLFTINRTHQWQWRIHVDGQWTCLSSHLNWSLPADNPGSSW